MRDVRRDSTVRGLCGSGEGMEKVAVGLYAGMADVGHGEPVGESHYYVNRSG